jgi:aspartate carbamoyltransferase catalytic subunit
MKVDMVVMRHANPGAAYFLSKKSIINAGDGAHEHLHRVIRQLFY